MITRSKTRHLVLAVAGALITGVLGAAAPAQAVDCYPPGSCAPDTPDYEVVKAELALGAASGQVCTGGVCETVPAEKTVTATAVEFTVGGATVRIAPLTAAGTPRQVTASGDLVITSTAGVTVTLTGLKPGTWVDVYINSERILLGKVQVGASGNVTATMPLPAGLPLGPHTVQVAGTTPSGAVISAALGVLVTPVKLAATGSRYFIVSARPGVPGFATAKVGGTTRIKVGLASAVNGARVVGAAGMKLPSCSTRATVKTAAGKALVRDLCLSFTKTSPKAFADWKVPAGYTGKAKVTFTFAEAGRKAQVRTQAITITK